MAELNWQENSKAMFDKMIEASPKPFRAMTEKKLAEIEAEGAAAGRRRGSGGGGNDRRCPFIWFFHRQRV